MKFGIFQILILALPLAAQPANVRSQQVSNTQALLTYTAPDSFPCVLEVSESPTYTPLVHEFQHALDLAKFPYIAASACWN